MHERSDIIYQVSKIIYDSFQVSIFSYLVELGLLLLYSFRPFYEVYLILPYLSFEIFLFLKNLKVFQFAQLNLSLLIDRQMEYIASMLTCSFICVYIMTHDVDLSFSGIPIYVSAIYSLHINKSISDPAERFLNMMQLLARITKSVVYFCVALYFDGYSDFSELLPPITALCSILFIAFVISAFIYRCILLTFAALLCVNFIYSCYCVATLDHGHSEGMIGPIIFGICLCLSFFVYSFIVKTKTLVWTSRPDIKDNVLVVENPNVALERISTVYYQKREAESSRTNHGESGANKCGICLDTNASAVFIECFHGGICLNCALYIFRTTKTCHLCRKNISKIYEIERADGFFKVTRQIEISP